MSILTLRRKHKAICPACKSPNYARQINSDEIKPCFKCLHCGHFWEYGYDGGIYMIYLEGETK